MKLHISNTGNDNFKGSFDLPLKSIQRALDIIKEQHLKKPNENCEIILHGGEHVLSETLVVTPRHSNSNAELSLKSLQGEKAKITSAHPVNGWRPSCNPDIPKDLKGKVWECPVAESVAYKGDFKVLYKNGVRLERARSKAFFPELENDSSRKFFDLDILHIPAELMPYFLSTGSPEVFVRPHQSWVVNYLDIEYVDQEAGLAKTAIPATYRLDKIGNMQNTPNCYVENVLKAMNKNGDWVLDKNAGMLFLCSQSDPSEDDIRFPALKELIRIEGNELAGDTQLVENLNITDITFCGCDRDVWNKDDCGIQHDWDMHDKGNAILRFRGAQNCAITNCKFANSGSGGIRLDLFARAITISANKIENLGGTGILLCGYGPGKNNLNNNNIIHNNKICRIGQLFWHAPGIFVWQSGNNRISNNQISDLHYNGIVLSGIRPRFFGIKDPEEWGTNFDMPEELREHRGLINYAETGKIKSREHALAFAFSTRNIVQDNEIFDTVKTLGDGNSIYLSCAGPGNIIRRNVIYNSPKACTDIRFDDDQEESIVEQNIIFGNGIKLKHTNHILNNIIIGGGIILFRSAHAGSKVEKNIIYLLYNHGFIYNTDFDLISSIKPDRNCYYGSNPQEIKVLFDKIVNNTKADKESIFADPEFEDLLTGCLKIKSRSPAFVLGIEQIDYKHIGLISDPAYPRMRKALSMLGRAGCSPFVNYE